MNNIHRLVAVLLLSVSGLAVPSVLSAESQNEAAKLTAAIGKGVIVTEQDGTRTKGTLVAATGQEIVLGTGEGDRTLSLAAVRDIRKRSHPVLIGTLVGTGVGAFLSFWEVNSGADYGPEVLLWPAIGAGAGVAVGFGIRSSGVIYRSPKSAAVAFAPIVTNARRGVIGVIAW